MANRIAGITVEIGGDTTKLSTALQDQNSKSKERIRLEEQRAKYEQKLREQIKKDERR